MKILVFSDVHLTEVFNQQLFDYIVKLVKSADQVILNGDFWDAYLTDFDSFCKSQWQQLFPLLKEKKTVYVLGNHDKTVFMDERVNLFSVLQTREYTFKSGKKTFFVTHGDQFAPTYDASIPYWATPAVRVGYRLFLRLKQFPQLEKIYVQKRRKDGYRKLVKITAATAEQRNRGLICIVGHSHFASYDGKNGFYSLSPMQPPTFGHCFVSAGTVNCYSKKYTKY